MRTLPSPRSQASRPIRPCSPSSHAKSWRPPWTRWSWRCWPRPACWAAGRCVRGRAEVGDERGPGRSPAGPRPVRPARGRPGRASKGDHPVEARSPRRERRQWAVAHEIGEHTAHRLFGRLGVDPRETAEGARETVASHLAGLLLLPTEWFAADGNRCGWDLLTLKSRYSTASHELIARRMLECRPPVIISIFDHHRLHFRRSNLPGRVPAPSPAEIDCWRSVHDRNRPEQTNEGLRTIQCWPVHEEEWKREILRTEVEDYPVESRAPDGQVGDGGHEPSTST